MRETEGEIPFSPGQTIRIRPYMSPITTTTRREQVGSSVLTPWRHALAVAEAHRRAFPAPTTRLPPEPEASIDTSARPMPMSGELNSSSEALRKDGQKSGSRESRAEHARRRDKSMVVHVAVLQPNDP